MPRALPALACVRLPPWPSLVPVLAQLVWDAEAVFRRCLPQLEREGDDYHLLRRRKSGLKKAFRGGAGLGRGAGRFGGLMKTLQAAGETKAS